MHMKKIKAQILDRTDPRSKSERVAELRPEPWGSALERVRRKMEGA